MRTFDPPFSWHRVARGLSVLDDVAADRDADELLLSYAFDVDLSDIVWMLSQVAPDLEEEMRSLLLAKLPSNLIDKKKADIPESVRADIDAWRQVYRSHPYSADERIRRTLREMAATEERA